MWICDRQGETETKSFFNPFLVILGWRAWAPNKGSWHRQSRGEGPFCWDSGGAGPGGGWGESGDVCGKPGGCMHPTSEESRGSWTFHTSPSPTLHSLLALLSRACRLAHLSLTALWGSIVESTLSHPCDFHLWNGLCSADEGYSLPVVNAGWSSEPFSAVQKLLGVFQGGLIIHLHSAGLSHTLNLV